VVKTIAAVFSLVILHSVVCGRASAQAGSACNMAFSEWSWEQPYPGVFGCIPLGIEGEDPCNLRTASCPPVAAPAETCPFCANGTAGNPINLATGNTYIEETDVRLPGLGGGLSLVRTWNSMWPATQSASQVGLFGPNWRSNFEERVFVGSDYYIKYARGDGSFWSFGVGGPGWTVAAPANQQATLVEGSTYWTLTLKNGEQRLFNNTSGNLIAIIDRNGNTTQLSYDGIGRLTTVTDPASRHLYFSYANGSSFLVTGVTSDFGVTTSYTYDNQSRLSLVTEPDQSTLSFQYDSNSNITAVVDSNGKILESHTYDSLGRGLTSSRANGVEALTISYQ
jgi:YD repeat-containing protein